MRLSAAFLVAAALLAAAAAAATAEYTWRTECLNKEYQASDTTVASGITALGGPADSESKTCKSLPFTGILRGHTSLVHLKSSNNAHLYKPCYQLEKTSAEYKNSGCGLFSEVSDKAREIEGLILTFVKAVMYPKHQGKAAAKLVDAINTKSNTKVWITDAKFFKTKLEVKPTKEDECTGTCKKLTWEELYKLAATATTGKPKMWAGYMIQGLSLLATDTSKRSLENQCVDAAWYGTPTGYASKTVKALPTTGTTTLAKVMTFHVASNLYGDKKCQIDTKFAQLLRNGNVKCAEVPGYGTVQSKDYYELMYGWQDTDEERRAMRCLPVLHGQVGFNLGYVHNDLAKKCSNSQYAIKGRPGCSRLAVAQLLNWHRSMDDSRPFTLVGSFASRHSAIRQNTANFLKAEYKKETMLNACTAATRPKSKSGKSGPKRVVCQAFTECYKSVMHFIAAKYPACTGAVVEDKVEDDNMETVGIESVLGLPVGPMDGELKKTKKDKGGDVLSPTPAPTPLDVVKSKPKNEEQLVEDLKKTVTKKPQETGTKVGKSNDDF